VEPCDGSAFTAHLDAIRPACPHRVSTFQSSGAATARITPAKSKPTRGLEPRTPSLRVSWDDLRLAFLSHISASEMDSDDLTFAEFGTYFGTRMGCSRDTGT
jgi:hypothetical protein